MDPITASYYRSILFHDGEDQRPLPPSLVMLHAWAFRRFQALGAGSIISKQSALAVAMTWLSGTTEGRAFSREQTELGNMFSEQEESPVVENASTDWDTVPAETDVIVLVGETPTEGMYVRRRGGWLDIRIQGVEKPFRSSQVKLAEE